MKKLFLILGICLVQVLQAQNLRKNIAYEDEHVRFTVIADGAVRLEYAPDGQFVDAKSFVAVEREYPAAEYKVKKGDCFYFKANKSHYLKNEGKCDTEILWISSPPNF